MCTRRYCKTTRGDPPCGHNAQAHARVRCKHIYIYRYTCILRATDERKRARERDALDGLVSCRVYVVVVAAAVNIFSARTFDDDNDDDDGGGQRWGVLGIVYILLWWRVAELLRFKMFVAHVYFSRSGCGA